jgi:hypothetical protein
MFLLQQTNQFLRKQMPTIANAVFMFTRINEPVKKFKSDDLEYQVNCVIPKADAKAWKKAFPKNGVKELSPEEYQDKFKVEPHNDDDEFFVINVKKPHTKNGVELPIAFKPRVFLKTSEGNIETDKLVGNGSKGTLQYSVREVEFEGSKANFPQLTAILVTDLIEYAGSNPADLFAELGAVTLSNKAPAQKAAKEADEEFADEPKEVVVKKPAKPKAPIEEFSDSPF